MQGELSEAEWRKQGEDVLRRMEETLAIVDEMESLGAVGVHLDLAICRLRTTLSKFNKDLVDANLTENLAETTSSQAG